MCVDHAWIGGALRRFDGGAAKKKEQIAATCAMLPRRLYIVMAYMVMACIVIHSGPRLRSARAPAARRHGEPHLGGADT